MAYRINPTSDAEWLTAVRRILSYDPDTGLFTWMEDRQRPRTGTVAGSVNATGYTVIVVGGRRVRAHRLAWLFLHGELPPTASDIDHINGVRSDNRARNLRLATRSQNMANRARKGRSSQYHGVCFDKDRGKWLAQAKAASGTKLHQRFDTEHEAARAYDAFVRAHHGAFAKPNFGESHV